MEEEIRRLTERQPQAPSSSAAHFDYHSAEPIIHILPNSSLDEASAGGITMGHLASSTSALASASRRAPSHSPAAQSHAQQADHSAAAAAAAPAAPAAAAAASSLRASGRSKSGSAVRGPGSHAYAQVGPRIRSDQFNAHLASSAHAGIDQQAEEDHLRREAQRQALKREKREMQKQQQLWEQQQQQQQEQMRVANLQLQRQQTLQEQFARYTHLQQLQQQHQQDALQAPLFSPAAAAAAAPGPSPSSSLHASSAEGFDRRHRLPLANWSLEREVAWQNDRAEQARKEAAAAASSGSTTTHMTATIKVVETSDEKRPVPWQHEAGAGAGAARQFSPSPSRTQHRFIREEVREQERAKLFQQRYGEK